ncbi:MAG: hypothetical protein ACK6AH_13320, partial [Gemmatimonadota bacterium]
MADPVVSKPLRTKVPPVTAYGNRKNGLLRPRHESDPDSHTGVIGLPGVVGASRQLAQATIVRPRPASTSDGDG